MGKVTTWGRPGQVEFTDNRRDVAKERRDVLKERHEDIEKCHEAIIVNVLQQSEETFQANPAVGSTTAVEIMVALSAGE